MVYKIVSTIIVILLIILNFKTCDKSTNQASLLESLGDSLRISRNKAGQEEAKNRTLSVFNSTQLLDVVSKDNEILELQNTVREYKGKLRSATYLQSVTQGTVITKTVVTEGTNTDVFPTYTGTFNTPWYSGTVVANKESVTNNYQVTNKFRIIEGKESNGWFKKKVYTSTVVNLNPNTTTKEFKTVVVTGSPKRVTLGLQVGYGLAVPTFKPTAYIGVGANIHLIGIK